MKQGTLMVLAFSVIWVCVAGLAGAAELGTAFTYQGRLRLEGLPLNEPCDLQFSLWTAEENGSQVGSTATISNVLPSGGEFTTELDFGPGAFTGEARFLEVAVRRPAGSGSYTTLAPRQGRLATPHALYALTAAQAATALGAPWSGLSGVPAGFADGTDNDTQYGAGSGLQLSGGVFSIPSKGVTTALLAENAVTSAQIANDAVTTTEILDGTVSKADLAATGGSENQILKLGSGGTLTWADDGLKIPFEHSGAYGQTMVKLTSENEQTSLQAISAGSAIVGQSSSMTLPAMQGENTSGGAGVLGTSKDGTGVKGSSTNYIGVWATSENNYGLYARSEYKDAINAYSHYKTGVTADSIESHGVSGSTSSATAYGVKGMYDPNSNEGWLGSASYGACGEHHYTGNLGYMGGLNFGTYGIFDASGNYGYLGTVDYGVYGKYGDSKSKGALGSTHGVWGWVQSGLAGRYAGYFEGPVYVSGPLTKAGGGFRIDHPLDPAGQYLTHSFVESPDMKNVYDGVAVLDEQGQAEVTLPEWFEALNRDFRYQLTCIGGFAPVYIAEEISGNRFRIAGGTRGLKVSWQVTGIRQDAWAEANRLPVEEAKPAPERGRFIHPQLFGEPDSESLQSGFREPPKPAKPVSSTPGEEAGGISR